MASDAPIPDPAGEARAGLRWFKALVLLGVAANLVLAGLGLLDPGAIIAFLRLEPASPLVWPRFACFLLILLSIFYLPGALDPPRHRFAAVFAVVCRFGGFAFFAATGGFYIIFGLYDLFFGVLQAAALWRGRAALRGEAAGR